MNRCRTSNSPILNIFIRSGDIRRQTSKSTEIGPNFACFWPLKILEEGSPKILDRDYRIERSIEQTSIVQNFVPIGRQSSEITQRKKKKKTTAKHKSFQKLSFSGGLTRTSRVATFCTRRRNAMTGCRKHKQHRVTIV